MLCWVGWDASITLPNLSIFMGNGFRCTEKRTTSDPCRQAFQTLAGPHLLIRVLKISLQAPPVPMGD